jgi:hypothetical protein
VPRRLAITTPVVHRRGGHLSVAGHHADEAGRDGKTTAAGRDTLDRLVTSETSFERGLSRTPIRRSLKTLVTE